MIGIYEIVNIESGKSYIGSSSDVRKRWVAHKWALKSGKHHSQYLQRAWDKYGEKLFKFVILEETSKENLINLENYYLLTYTPEYNAMTTASLPIELTDEQKRAISDKMKYNRNNTDLCIRDILDIRLLYWYGANARYISGLYDIEPASTYAITSGKNWSHVPILPLRPKYSEKSKRDRIAERKRIKRNRDRKWVKLMCDSEEFTDTEIASMFGYSKQHVGRLSKSL